MAQLNRKQLWGLFWARAEHFVSDSDRSSVMLFPRCPSSLLLHLDNFRVWPTKRAFDSNNSALLLAPVARQDWQSSNPHQTSVWRPQNS